MAGGYVDDNKLAYLCFRQYKDEALPYELRSLFVTLTVEGYPTLLIWDDADLKSRMMQDYLQAHNGNDLMATHLLIQEISRKLNLKSKTMSDYGLPEPQENISETDFQKLKYSPTNQHELFETLTKTKPFTAEMVQLFEAIKTALSQRRDSFFFLQGQGGSGYYIC
jgi:hypothetical protein